MRSLLGFVAAVAVAACGSTGSATRPSPQGGEPAIASKETKLGGIVVETQSGKPLAGVTVLLLSQAPSPAKRFSTDCTSGGDSRCAVVTDASGHFEFRVESSGERSLALLYSDFTVIWKGSVCQGSGTNLKIPFNVTQAGGEVIHIQGDRTKCSGRRSKLRTTSCPDKPLIDPTGVPGRDQLSTSPHKRPSLAQAYVQLPKLLGRYRAATYQAVTQKSLKGFSGSVSGCTKMADLITFLFKNGHFSSLSSMSENAAPTMSVVLANVMSSLKPVAVRVNKDSKWAVDVFLSKDATARTVPASEVHKLDRKKEMALLITRQDGELVLAGVSKPLIDYVQWIWRRTLM